MLSRADLLGFSTCCTLLNSVDYLLMLWARPRNPQAVDCRTWPDCMPTRHIWNRSSAIRWALKCFGFVNRNGDRPAFVGWPPPAVENLPSNAWYANLIDF